MMKAIVNGGAVFVVRSNNKKALMEFKPMPTSENVKKCLPRNFEKMEKMTLNQ